MAKSCPSLATQTSRSGSDSPLRARRRRQIRLGLRGTLALFLVGFIGAVALIGPSVAPSDPTAQQISQRLRPPLWDENGSSAYLLGTDQLGRDLLSRLLYGARISLMVSLAAAAGSAVLGVLLGVLAGFYRGWIDDVVMRLVEIQLAFPYLLLAITIMAVLAPSMRNVILVLAISGWVVHARLVRGITLSLAQKEFVISARALGCSDRRLIMRHILPNLVPVITIVLTLQVAQFVIAESALSFLGLGLRPPTPSWGSIMNEGRQYLELAWWIETFPGLAIMVATTGIGLLGDWLRDILDPQLRV